MSGIYKTRSLTIGVAVLLGGIVLGCADNEESIYVRGVLAWPSSECVFKSDPESPMIMAGSWDVGLSNEYRANLLIANQMVPRGSGTELKTESSTFRAEWLDVGVERTNGTSLVSYSYPVTGLVDPAVGGVPGWGTVSGALANVDVKELLAGEILAAAGRGEDLLPKVVSVARVWGRTLGGKEIRSAEFRFTVVACFGCLVVVPSSARDPEVPGPNCRNLEGYTAKDVCVFGQDGYVDCRYCDSIGLPNICGLYD